jgi:hypothetical protein
MSISLDSVALSVRRRSLTFPHNRAIVWERMLERGTAAMGKLTALRVKAATKPGRHHDGRGLMLLVKAGGSRSWVVRLQVDGKRRDFGLGSAVDVSLSEARSKADEIRKLCKNGVDPIAAKRAERAARSAISTFEEAASAGSMPDFGSLTGRTRSIRRRWALTYQPEMPCARVRRATTCSSTATPA